MRQVYVAACFALVSLAGVGCSSGPPAPPPSGFLGAYANVKPQGDGSMRYVSPKLKEYDEFILEPVQMSGAKNLNEQERAEVASHFNQTLIKYLDKRGFRLVGRPGPSVARVRVAVTDVQQSKWYAEVHETSKLPVPRTGGTSLESEIVDSRSGEQLAAVIKPSRGDEFALDSVSNLDQAKAAIDRWAAAAGDRLDQLRRGY